MRPRARAATLAAALVMAGGRAGAEPSPDEVLRHVLPDAPSPPSQLDLTHRGVGIALESTVASIKPYDVQGVAQQRKAGFVGRLEGEAALARRSWYAGLALEGAYGSPSGVGQHKPLFGYPEVWGRAVWSSRAGLAYGLGLSLVLPVFSRERDAAASLVAESIRVVRPWDIGIFADNTFTAMPFLDARVIDGNVTFQLRQGFALQGLVAEARLPDASVVSRTTVYLGYQPVPALAFGVEAWEVYFISADFEATCAARRRACDDSLRAVFAVSPSVRLMNRVFQPALSALFPFSTTLYDGVESYWAVRLTLSAIVDPW